jgi:transposase InsO family protein
LAGENRDWGYQRIQGALSNLGYEIGESTIAAILKRHGLEPAPERTRKTTWKEFLTRHWDMIVATDFFTVEVWTKRGLQRFMVLFIIDLATRKVEIAGIAPVVNGLWMNQVARNLTDAVDGVLAGKKFLIHDRDPLFTAEFLRTLEAAGVKSVKLPPRSPNLNPHAERFVRSIKESCLDRLIFFREASLRTAVQNFLEHYHAERNHQGLSNRLICPDGYMTKRTGKQMQKPIRKRYRVWFERKVAELKAEAERLPEARQDELKRKLAGEE